MTLLRLRHPPAPPTTPPSPPVPFLLAKMGSPRQIASDLTAPHKRHRRLARQSLSIRYISTSSSSGLTRRSMPERRSVMGGQEERVFGESAARRRRTGNTALHDAPSTMLSMVPSLINGGGSSGRVLQQRCVHPDLRVPVIGQASSKVPEFPPARPGSSPATRGRWRSAGGGSWSGSGEQGAPGKVPATCREPPKPELAGSRACALARGTNRMNRPAATSPK